MFIASAHCGGRDRPVLVSTEVCVVRFPNPRGYLKKVGTLLLASCASFEVRGTYCANK
jgi:hypothetical protein